MSDLEDAVRAAMRAKDATAPAPRPFALDPAPRAARRPGWRAPIAAVAAIVAIFALTYGVSSRFNSAPPATLPTQTVVQTPTPDTAPALTCPGSFGGKGNDFFNWVPEKPQGVDGADQLAPSQTPAHVVVCDYHNRQNTPFAGARTLTGDLAPVASALSWAPVQLPDQFMGCDLMVASDLYLIGLSYPGGTVWVSGQNDGCGGSTNGEFTSWYNFGQEASDWYSAGHWTAPASSSGCTGHGIAGRRGQESAMVPGTPTGLAICRFDADLTTPATAITGDFTPLVQALNALPSQTNTSACGGSIDMHESYTLIFSYAEGPNVLVNVFSGCHPAINNISLQAADASTVLPLIDQLMAGH